MEEWGGFEVRSPRSSYWHAPSHVAFLTKYIFGAPEWEKVGLERGGVG